MARQELSITIKIKWDHIEDLLDSINQDELEIEDIRLELDESESSNTVMVFRPIFVTKIEEDKIPDDTDCTLEEWNEKVDALLFEMNTLIEVSDAR